MLYSYVCEEKQHVCQTESFAHAREKKIDLFVLGFYWDFELNYWGCFFNIWGIPYARRRARIEDTTS